MISIRAADDLNPVHVAFQIRDEDLDDIALRIKSLGLEVREARNRIAGEGQSLYVAARKHKWSGSITSAFWTQIICNYRRCRAQIDCERTQIICDGTANINQWAQIH